MLEVLFLRGINSPTEIPWRTLLESCECSETLFFHGKHKLAEGVHDLKKIP